jgi:DNA repair protein RadD
VLISVDALAKGFDVQDVGCVIDARPLRKSLSTAIQMWGRGLRSSPGTGKRDCILLDHSGNIVRFREDFERVYFEGFGSLDDSEKLDRVAREDDEAGSSPQCPACRYTPFFKRCMACGYEKPVQPLVDEAPGVMQEIRIGKRVAAADHADLWNQLCTYARVYVRGKQAGWAWHKYREIAGQQVPTRFPRFDDTPDVPVSSALIGKLKSMRIAYHKAREADAPRLKL